MYIYSLKFTFRSLFRDVIRGLPARLFVYPRLKKNEFSFENLSLYTKQADGNVSKNLNSLSVIGKKSDCIDKDTVRADPEKFTAPRSLRTIVRTTIKTSGSTGRPLTIVQDFWAVVKEEAFVYRQLRWTGYRHRDRRVWLRGDVVCSNNPNNRIFGCRDWWTNTLMLSSYHLSASTIAGYVNTIRDFNPVLIQAYPSSIYGIAAWMLANNVRYTGKSLLAIVTSSETLEAHMKISIEKAFNCSVFDWYGQAERVVAIGTCERGKHHVLTDYGITELLPVEDGLYELVGTGYNNRAMPLAKYRTGDIVDVGMESCSCKRIFPVIKKVIGRRDRTIVLSDGRIIGRLDHVFKGIENVVEGQVVYRGNNCFVLRVVPGAHWDYKDAELMKAQLQERVHGAQVIVETVSSIPRGPNGKFEFVRLEGADR